MSVSTLEWFDYSDKIMNNGGDLGMVRTVLGEITPEQMGNTSAHEHVFNVSDPDRRYCQEDCGFAIEELKKAKDAGLDTIIEVTPGADPRQLAYIAERSPVNVVACTGFYCFWTEEQKEYTAERFLEKMLFEAEQGIEGSGVMPGVIKIASFRPNLLPCEVRALTAAGRAQKMTGLPLCVHSATGTRYQQYLIEAAGADMEKVYFSHMESPTDREGRTLPMQIEYIIRTMERGSLVSFNGYGFPPYLDPGQIREMITAIVERGYAKKFLLSMDCYWGYQDGKRHFNYQERDPNVTKRTYAYLMTDVLPWLRGFGISEEVIGLMLRDNVHNMFR
jgi:phosphotriesterase-related protein